MRQLKLFPIIVLLLSLVFTYCGKSDKEKDMEDAAEQMEEGGLENMAEAMKKMGEILGKDGVEPVDFRDLKKLLPKSLPGMKREDASGEKTSVMGIKVSKAEASYYDENNNGSIDISITDMGTVSGFAAMASMAWAFSEYDRESDSGYEKTTTYKGHKTFEKFDSRSEFGEINVLIEKRFVVEVSGNNVEMKKIKNALKKVDVDKIEDLK
jgi:hypothetical protein